MPTNIDLSNVVWEDETSSVNAETVPSFTPISSTAAIPAPNEITKDTELTVPPMENDFSLPQLRPSPTLSKQYSEQIKEYHKIARKIEDPNDRAIAVKALGTGARLDDIAATFAVLENRTAQSKAQRAAAAEAKKQKLASENKMTLDKSKAEQKYTQQAAAYQTSGALLNRLVNKFDTKYIGLVDSWYQNAAQSVPVLGDDSFGPYKQDFDALFLTQKDANNMGANFTGSEQAMLRAAMPDMGEEEGVYKRKLVNYIRTMRDIVGNKVKKLEDGGYKTGELGKTSGYLERVYQNALKKFAIKDDELTTTYGKPMAEAEAKPTSTRRSLLGDMKNENTQTKKKPASREEMLQMLRGK